MDRLNETTLVTILGRPKGEELLVYGILDKNQLPPGYRILNTSYRSRPLGTQDVDRFIMVNHYPLKL